MNIELHIERVQSILDQMDLQKKCKFAAWCCNALIIEKKIEDGKIEDENLKREYEIQLLFLDDLRNSIITLQDIKKYR